MLGVQAGGLVHVFAAAIGVSALIASSAEAFTVVKFAGAAYLVYLGVQRIRHAGEDDHEQQAPRSHAHLFRQGVVVNVLNPKVAIFFVAFLPQFIDPDAGSPGLQIVVLGLLFIAIAMISDGTYALLAGTAAEHLRGSFGARQRLDRISGRHDRPRRRRGADRAPADVGAAGAATPKPADGKVTTGAST